MANNAKQAKKAEAPAKKVVKASGVKVRTREEARPFLSKRDTQPLNDVTLPNGEVVKGLTEEEKIAQGYLKPLRRVPRFRKNKYDRGRWHDEHSNAKGPTGGTAKKNYGERKATLIVHLLNPSKLSTFTTTRSFTDVRFSEIVPVLRAALGVRFDANPYELVSSFYHAGKKYQIDSNGAAKAV